ncbi:MAG: RNA-binding protein [Acidobacteriia bacterium]|nr:RNA-binding protein [Terriglobia bacterium]
MNTGYSRGFAFVGMTDDVDAAKAVLILDGTNVWGKPLKVEAAKPELQRSRPAGIWGELS